MQYITYEDVLAIHRRALATSGGSTGIRDDNALRSAVDQPRMSAFGQDLYPTLAEKAAALGFSLIQNHPFVDGNKRVGHACMEYFLMGNGFESSASTDESEAVVLSVASGTMSRDLFTEWVRGHLVPVAG